MLLYAAFRYVSVCVGQRFSFAVVTRMEKNEVIVVGLGNELFCFLIFSSAVLSRSYEDFLLASFIYFVTNTYNVRH